MPKVTPGSATIDSFFDFMNRRHDIFLKKERGDPWPWTTDPIFQEFRFTNVYRELDQGTLWLRHMLPTDTKDPWFIVFNVIWYRMFNWWEHARDIGAVDCVEYLADRIHRRKAAGFKLFTSAHMTVGKAREAKEDTMLRSLREIWDDQDRITRCMNFYERMEDMFDVVTEYFGIGKFIGYEIVTDLRHYPALWKNETPLDLNDWANIGPGCKRGLIRLDLAEDSLTSLRYLLHRSPEFLADWMPKLELRDIEHSLCEFDKYERARLGQGRPKERYHGREHPST